MKKLIADYDAALQLDPISMHGLYGEPGMGQGRTRSV